MASNKYSETINQYSQNIKTLLFGENNSRLDFIIEQFYRLNHERRSSIIVASIATAVVLFIAIIVTYFISIFSLQNRLSNAYTNTNTLKEIKTSYVGVQTKFEEITNSLISTNSNLNLISMVEQKAKDLGVQVSGFPSKPALTKFPSQYPLAENFQRASIDFKLSNISIKKMLEFINNIEELPNKLKVTKYRLISLTDAKLYFEVYLTVEALVPNENANK